MHGEYLTEVTVYLQIWEAGRSHVNILTDIVKGSLGCEELSLLSLLYIPSQCRR